MFRKRHEQLCGTDEPTDRNRPEGPRPSPPGVQKMPEFRVPKFPKWPMCFFPEMSKIHFPGLGTLRLAIWTTYFLIFPICLGNFFNFCLTDFWSIFVYFPLGLPSNMIPIGPVWAGPMNILSSSSSSNKHHTHCEGNRVTELKAALFHNLSRSNRSLPSRGNSSRLAL